RSIWNVKNKINIQSILQECNTVIRRIPAQPPPYKVRPISMQQQQQQLLELLWRYPPSRRNASHHRLIFIRLERGI
ncbi:MAG TPA: hypothetical protein VJ695_05345, partial [Nitrososphaera sp.]|nr:hypothetical protein [Nitrososphaera sp.]